MTCWEYNFWILIEWNVVKWIKSVWKTKTYHFKKGLKKWYAKQSKQSGKNRLSIHFLSGVCHNNQKQRKNAKLFLFFAARNKLNCGAIFLIYCPEISYSNGSAFFCYAPSKQRKKKWIALLVRAVIIQCKVNIRLMVFLSSSAAAFVSVFIFRANPYHCTVHTRLQFN